jgi:predicted Fe-Mo cluster-binding NifX family protein
MDELEALRLIDLQEMSQVRAATEMGVSRATIGRVVARARSSVARALVQGRRILIEGGAVAMADPNERSKIMRIALAIDRRGGLARHLRRSEAFQVFDIENDTAVKGDLRPNPRRDDPGSGGRGERRHLHPRGQGLGPHYGSGIGGGPGHGGGQRRGSGGGGGGGIGCGREEHHRHGHGAGHGGGHGGECGDRGGRGHNHGATALQEGEEHPHGARGRWLVELLGDCEVVIARGMGTRLQTALRAAGIRPIVLEARVSPEEALEMYREGRL